MNKIKYDTLNTRKDHDVAEVARIHCAAPSEWVDDHFYSEESLSRAIAKLRNPGNRNHVLLARNPEDEIVGLHWVQLEVTPEAKLGSVFSLWVCPRYRVQGVATHLKKLAEAWLINNGAREVRTMVYVDNSKMIALNKKLGYRVVRVGMSKRLS